jgi:hypothetical protein
MRYQILLAALLLAGCRKYDISVVQQSVNSSYLASSHVGTPDPRQAHPPEGEKLSVEWRIPTRILDLHPQLLLHLIFWDYTEKTVAYPLNRSFGWVTYSLLGEEFKKTQGILTYKIDIVTEGGDIYREWKHQLWVNLIKVEE